MQKDCEYNFGMQINYKKYAAVPYIETKGAGAYLVPKVRTLNIFRCTSSLS